MFYDLENYKIEKHLYVKIFGNPNFDNMEILIFIKFKKFMY